MSFNFKIQTIFLLTILFGLGVAMFSPSTANAACVAKFTKQATEPANFISSSDKERYDPENPPLYQVDIKFTDCVDELVRVTLVDIGTFAKNAEIDESVYSISITEDPMTAQITWLLGDNDCDGPTYLDDECDILTEVAIDGINNNVKSNRITTYKCWKNS